jgi:hypothetical protein
VVNESPLEDIAVLFAIEKLRQDHFYQTYAPRSTDQLLVRIAFVSRSLKGPRMLAIRLLGAVKKSATGTPGSSAVQRGFDVTVQTLPNFRAYRVVVVWSPDGWQSVNRTQCGLSQIQNDSDIWTASISYYTTPPITMFYALAAATPDGLSWDNNSGWNYMI